VALCVRFGQRFGKGRQPAVKAGDVLAMYGVLAKLGAVTQSEARQL
jgi:hypothetical protein